MKILFIGAGNMGQAILGGIIRKKISGADNISIYDVDEDTVKFVKKKYKVSVLEKINSTASDFDIIILAVKPAVFKNFENDEEMKKLKSIIRKDQIIISIMAGITIDKLKTFFSAEHSIVRVMPNAPALIGKSMSVISYSKNTSQAKLEIIKNIFKAIGEIEVLDEKNLDAVTALSGSGPAYVFTFIDALIKGGILCGLSKETAWKLAVQTVIGSCSMITENTGLDELVYKVASPGGTTIEALAVLEQRGFKSAIIDAVKAASDKAKKLGQDEKKS